MKSAKFLLAAAGAVVLSGCNFGESDCERYDANVALDRNNDGTTDYRFQFLGDSIIAYHDIACSSIGQQVGTALGEQILTNAVVGARMEEIAQQYQPPPNKSKADYEWVMLNGGVNDLMGDSAGGNNNCDCNGNINHQGCLSMIADLRQDMEQLVNKIKASSNANVAIIAYYPPDDENSFLGACFPYVDTLNDQYRQMSYSDPRLRVVETAGDDIPWIQKIENLGYDGYHPTPSGAGVVAVQIVKSLKLKPLP